MDEDVELRACRFIGERQLFSVVQHDAVMRRTCATTVKMMGRPMIVHSHVEGILSVRLSHGPRARAAEVEPCWALSIVPFPRLWIREDLMGCRNLDEAIHRRFTCLLVETLLLVGMQLEGELVKPDGQRGKEFRQVSESEVGGQLVGYVEGIGLHPLTVRVPRPSLLASKACER